MPSMPGSGTWVPLVVLVPPVLDPVLDEELELEDDEEEVEVDELVLLELEVLPVQFFLQ